MPLAVVMRAGQASRGKTRSTGGILSWIALAAMAGLLLLVAFAVLVSGAPYYLTPDPLRPTHALDPRFAPGSPLGLMLGMVRDDALYTRGFQTTKFAVSDAQRLSDHLALWAQMQRSE